VKTIDEIADELYARGRDAEAAALVMILLLDYEAELILDAQAYRVEVRKVLDAMDRVRERRLAEYRATAEQARAELDRCRAEVAGKVCSCGRPAVEMLVGPDGEPTVPYCGIPGGGAS